MPRVVAYARVSTDKQDADNQRFELERFADGNHLTITDFIEETVSGKAEISERRLGEVLQTLQRGDVLIVSEISRISRRLLDVMEVLKSCISRGVTIRTVRDGFTFQDDINSHVMAFAFGLAAEIERRLISQRTKEALARKKSEGVKLGRPAGTHHDYHRKLHSHEADIQRLVQSQVSLSAIARLYNVNRETVRRFVEDRKLRDIETGV